MLPKFILVNPAAGRRLSWRDILRQVKSRLRRWATGDYTTLWSEAQTEGCALSRQARAPSTSPNTQWSHNARHAQDGLYSKAIQALSSEGLASISPEVLQEMQSNHPQATPTALPLGPVPPPTPVSEACVLKVVKTSCSAAGPSGLRPTHLSEAVCCPAPDRAREALTSLVSFVNVLAAGLAPTPVLLSSPAGRKMADFDPSLLEKYYDD